MLRLAWPIIVINASLTVMQFADAFMVAPLGDVALAAILPAGLLFFVPIAACMGLLSSVNPFVSQSLGRGDPEGCGRSAWHGVAAAVVLGLCIIALWPLTPAIFRLMGHEVAVQGLEVAYFRICLLSAPSVLVGAAFSNFFIGIHRPRVLVCYAVIATALNIAFNYVLIYGRLGFPAMGMAGAAAGTAVACTLQTAALGIHFIAFGDSAKFGVFPVRFSPHEMLAMLRVGIPSALQFGFDVLSWGVALVWMVGLFGTEQLAATTIIVRFMHLSFMPAVGLSTVLTAMVGKAIGEGNPDLAMRQVTVAFRAIALYMGAIGLAFFVFRRQAIDVFTDSPQVIEVGASIMVCVAFFQFFDSMHIVFSHALRGAGDTLWQALTMSSLLLVVFLGGGLAAVTFLPGLGSLGPWMAGTVYIALLGIALAIRWYGGAWRAIRLFDPTRS